MSTRPAFLLAVLPILFLARPAGALPLRFGSGFESTGQVTPASGLVMVDVDRDGTLDAVVSDATETSSPHSVSVMRGLGNGRYAAPVFYPTGLFPMAVASADLNGDLWPDIVTANRGSSSLSVLLNKGDGTFFPRVNYSVGSGPRSVAIGDLDGDGLPDLVSANSVAGTISILRGLGAGTFAAKVDRASAADVRSLQVADWNQDGHLDVVAAGYASGTIAIHLGNGDGTIAAATLFPQPAAPLALDAKDLDGDGRPDLAVVWNGAHNASVFLQQPDGALAPRTDLPLQGFPAGVAIGDVTGDGTPDVVVTNWDKTPLVDLVSIFPGLGAGALGTRQDESTGGKPGAVALGETEVGGRRDLVVACTGSSTLAVHRANEDGTFGSRRDLAPHASVGQLVMADLDEDGKMDIVAAGTASIAWWRGNGDETFAAPVSYATTPVGWGKLALADMNGDGHLDALTIDGSAYNRVLISYGTGTGTFSSSVAITVPEEQIKSVTPVDLDADGRMDLAIGESWPDANVRLFRQTTPGQFTGSSFTFTFNNSAVDVSDITAGDVTGDGFPDLLLSTTNDIALARSNGPGTFAPVTFLPGSVSGKVEVADFNGDGKLDYAGTIRSSGTTGSSSIGVFLGDGAGSFTPRGPFLTLGGNARVLIADLDRDGVPDLVSAGGALAPGAPNTVSLLRGIGDGSFEGFVDAGVNVGPGSIGAADLNGDTLPELVVNGATITVLENLHAPVVAVTPDPAAGSVRLALGAPMPNPTRGAVTLTVTLPAPGTLAVRVFDVAGRMVAHQDRAGLAAGRQSIRLDAGAELRPGLYFVHVAQGAATATTRLVVVD